MDIDTCGLGNVNVRISGLIDNIHTTPFRYIVYVDTAVWYDCWRPRFQRLFRSAIGWGQCIVVQVSTNNSNNCTRRSYHTTPNIIPNCHTITLLCNRLLPVLTLPCYLDKYPWYSSSLHVGLNVGEGGLGDFFSPVSRVGTR